MGQVTGLVNVSNRRGLIPLLGGVDMREAHGRGGFSARCAACGQLAGYAIGASGES
jgi:hypothetical protein